MTAHMPNLSHIGTHYNKDNTQLIHLGVINPIIDADGLNGHVAITKCGKAVLNFHDETGTGIYYTDGTRYKSFCPRCFPEDENK